MEQKQNQLVTITKEMFKKKVYLILSCAALLGYYTYGYTTIPSSLDNDTTTKCLLAFVIMCYVSLFLDVCDAKVIYDNIGITIHHNFLEALKISNRFPFSFLKLVNLGLFGLLIYFMVNFTPIKSSNCGVYSDVYHACTTSQIIAITGYIVYALSSLVLLIILCCFPCFFCWFVSLLCGNGNDNGNGSHNDNDNGNDNDNNYHQYHTSAYVHHDTHNHIQNYASSVIRRVLPISSIAPSDKTCAICCDDAKDGDQWKELPCKHKFHPKCVDPWIKNNNTCPMCRATINPDAVNHNSISVLGATTFGTFGTFKSYFNPELYQELNQELNQEFNQEPEQESDPEIGGVTYY